MTCNVLYLLFISAFTSTSVAFPSLNRSLEISREIGDAKLRKFLLNKPTTTKVPTVATSGPVDDAFRKTDLFGIEKQPIKPHLMKSRRPACAKSDLQTFCDSKDVEDYPEDVIRSLVHYDQTEFSELFGLGAETGEKITIRRDDSNRVVEMTDEETDKENICAITTDVFYPRTARNKDKDWLYIVNDSEYVQAVTSEKCTVEGTACNYLTDRLPLDFKSHCRQKYSYKKLLAVHPDEAKTYTDYFPIPSCCTCYVSSYLGVGRRNTRRPTTPAPVTS